MRITIALGPYFPVPPVLGGGVETFQLALAEEFARRGHVVTMISRAYADFPREETSSGIRHIRVPSWDVPQSRIKFRLYDLLYSRRVARVLPESDITVTNSVFLPNCLPRKRAGRLYVHVARYPKGQMWLYSHVDRIQTVSAAVAEAIRRQTPVLTDRIIVIPPPLTGPLAVLVPADRLQDPRARTVLYVGRIAAEKGVHCLVEAFAGLVRGPLSGYRLRVVGPHEIGQGGGGADYLSRLRKLAAPAAESVSFEGFIPSVTALRAIFESADIFVYPSLAEKGESFGLAPLEAMAAGCRVLVSDLDCFSEYLEVGVNGRSFDHQHDPVRSLSAALTDLAIAENGPAMRKAAVATAAKYQLGPVVDRYLDDFCRLIQETSAA